MLHRLAPGGAGVRAVIGVGVILKMGRFVTLTDFGVGFRVVGRVGTSFLIGTRLNVC